MKKPRSAWHPLLSALLLLSLSAGGQDKQRRVVEEPPQTQRLNKLLEENKIAKKEDLLSVLPTKIPMGFTFVPKSQSNQKGERAITFAEDGFLFLGIGRSHTGAEAIVSNLETGERSFHRVQTARIGEAHMTLSAANPARCTECHTRKLVFIWEDYHDWPGVLGAEHDHVNDKDTDFTRISADPLWNRLFAHPPNGTKHRSPYFPYSSNNETLPYDVPTRMAHQPNTRATMLITRLTAKKLVHDLKTTRPLLFERYKYSFLSHLLQCDDIPKAHAEQIRQEYEKLVPETVKFWQKYYAQKASPEGEILQILGTNPDEIILKRAIERNEDRAQSLTAQFQGYLPYQLYADGLSQNLRGIQNYLVALLLPGASSKDTRSDFYEDYGDSLDPHNKIVPMKYPKSLPDTCAELKTKAAEALAKPLPTIQPLPNPGAPRTGHAPATR